MAIRNYTDLDWSAICEIYDLAKPQELAAAGVERGFVPLGQDPEGIESFRGFTTLVWEDVVAKRVAGFGGYQDDYIGWLFVHPAWQRRGVGRALLHEMMQRIGLENEPWLWVLRGNRTAYALYASEGFAAKDTQRVNIHGLICPAIRLVRADTGISALEGDCGSLPNPSEPLSREGR
jgi:GNAT superfamily N-acetyltransferase